ncbi:serine hydrolase [Allokutzneria sp. NRRL B-24872]|uniref:serine hydrolase n=1 Tax=Allokutzneria sp. NRRL B-24872 TaxID=1137961 RepID=UPI0011781ED7|nr:serine hydrolase [Allokutzneria sp. NRRL B-24872]
MAPVVTAALAVALGVALWPSRDAWASSCTGEISPSRQSAEVKDAARAIQSAARGASAGIAMVDLTGCTDVAGANASALFPSASVVKLLIALDALAGKESEPEGLERMLSLSDDKVASELWTANGGAAIVRRMSERIGLQHTRPPAKAGRWGETLTSAADVARIYQHISAKLPKERRIALTDALSSAPRTAADGFDQYFGIPSGLSDREWAIKQGWGSTDDRVVLNTTGMVGGKHNYVVVVLTSWPKNTSWPTAKKAVTKAVSELHGLVGSTTSP